MKRIRCIWCEKMVRPKPGIKYEDGRPLKPIHVCPICDSEIFTVRELEKEAKITL